MDELNINPNCHSMANRTTRRAVVHGSIAALAGRSFVQWPDVPWDDEATNDETNPPAVLVPSVRLDFINDYPKNRNNGWHEELNGVTHDDENWYISQKGRLWRFPVRHDLNAQIDTDRLPDGVAYYDIDDLASEAGAESLGLGLYDHFGGIDYYRNRVYVPLERVGWPFSHDFPPYLLEFSTDLKLLRGGLITGQSDNYLGWCAVNPVDGLLYTSRAGYVDRDHGLRTFTRDTFEFQGEVILLNAAGAPISFGGIQGGVFSPNGNLYLSSDTYTASVHPGLGGIVGFDMATRRRTVFGAVEHNKDDAEELQDLTLWDFEAEDAPSAPGCSGQFHILMLDNDGWFDDDDLYFKHYRVPAGARHLI
jgi:hypothetical protein